MICPFPLLNLPPIFNASTQREGQTTAASHVDNQTASVLIGFILDGVSKYTNISKALPNVGFALVPLQCPFPEQLLEIVYDPADRRSISIPVKRLRHLVGSGRDFR